MITKDMLPLSFVEGEGFRELMNFVEPEYRVPTRKTIVSRVELKYEEGVKKLKMDISQSEKVAITTDSWTALTTESYTTITCHYFTDDWEMKSAVLQTRSSDERHTAQNIAAQLQAAAEEWGLTDKITACVHDNAMVLANRTIADWESVPCYAHTLQLAINNGFKVGSVHRVVAACGRLVSHFHHSTVATAGLKKKQDAQNLPKHKLIQYSRTRWNSICDMFERLHEQRWAVSATLSDRTITKQNDARTLELTDQNWQVIEDILPALQSLKCAITALCSETHVCISLEQPVTNSLLTRHLMSIPGESRAVGEFKEAVATSLRKRIIPESDDTSAGKKPVYIASALDPRHKHLHFVAHSPLGDRENPV
ncbi:E3 SUMO-protein ligase ZBED1-like [Pseudochaenichthys georgianus]|uniref:E3 SUMO-protein ligase ZBED1-like n=1 Tax=Pseudochaenichthys georgianus TaxID=52239 RepID=UPI00146BCAF0|nr:zinc finger BED domain-containing protein 4-like [Pseudochaenichthys georgianus]